MNDTRGRVDGKQHDKRGESDAGGGLMIVEQKIREVRHVCEFA